MDLECPHRQELETTIQSCHTQTALMAATHANYLNIIDELKHDLESLSCEVKLDCGDMESVNGLEQSLHELETQNDRLQEALQENYLKHGRTIEVLQEKNENLKCQLTVLQQDLCDRDAQITHLNSLLNQFSKIDSNYVTQLEQELNRVKCQSEALVKELKCAQQSEHNVQCEARQLSEQLCDAKKKNCDFILANRKLATLLKSQEDHRLGVNTKYDKLEQEYEEQCKQLRAATCKLSSLQDRFMQMEKTQQEHHMERNLLREEVLALKEKEAVLVGKCRSLEDQNNNYEQEVIRSRALIRDQQRLLQCNDIAHEETVTRLKDCNNDVKKQLCDLIADYKQLQMQIKQHADLNEQNAQIVESFRKWRDAQVKSDETTRRSFKQYEEHVRLLLEEKQKYLEDYRSLYRDHKLVCSELNRLNKCKCPGAPKVKVNLNPSNSMDCRMEALRCASRRLSERSRSIGGALNGGSNLFGQTRITRSFENLT